MMKTSIFGFFRQIMRKIIEVNENDGMRLRGHVEIEVKNKHGQVIDKFNADNVILNIGKQKVTDAFISGNLNRIFRMAIGDDGAMTGDLLQPKTPDATMTALYHEVYRKDRGGYTVGTRQVLITADFNSADVPNSSFINAGARYINEAALVVGDGILGGPAIAAPALPDADESLFSIRCFKSIPFDAVDNITITIRWTIFVQ